MEWTCLLRDLTQSLHSIVHYPTQAVKNDYSTCCHSEINIVLWLAFLKHTLCHPRHVTLIYTLPLAWGAAYWLVFFSSIESSSKWWMETRCSFNTRKDFLSFGRNSSWQSACACWAWHAAVSVCWEILRLVNYITSGFTWVQ